MSTPDVNRSEAPAAAPQIDPRSPELQPFTEPDDRLAARQVVVTFALLALAWCAAVAAVRHMGVLAAIPFQVLGGLLLARCAVLAHDCIHGSLFRARWARDWTGRVVALLYWTPYWYWGDDHLSHHASNGNLDRRGLGDIPLATLREYRAMSLGGRRAYRLMRHPLVLFVLGPPLYFMVRMRFVAGPTPNRAAAWRSVIAYDFAIAAAVLALGSLAGWDYVLWGWIPILLVATWVSAWLFYVQHQFPEVYWRRDPEWQYRPGAFLGSSFYDLPPWLAWFTADLGLHDVHHVMPRIPNHRLRAARAAIPELQKGRRVGLVESFSFARLALYDEERRRLVSLAEAESAPA